MTRTDGELVEDGGGRWCATCNHEHGPLYLCEHYPRWVSNEIEAGQVANREAIRERICAGDRSTEIMVMAAFAGVDLTDL